MKKKYPIVDAFKSESSNISPEYVITEYWEIQMSEYLMLKNVSGAQEMLQCSLLKS